MTLRRVAMALALTLGLLVNTGCYHYRFTTGSEPGTQRVEEWQHIRGFGGVPDDPFDLESACGGGEVAEFGTYVSFTNALAALGTLTFYSPQTAYAICAQ